MGVISGPGLAPYSACKSGMIGLTKVCKICVFSSEGWHDCLLLILDKLLTINKLKLV